MLPQYQYQSYFIGNDCRLFVCFFWESGNDYLNIVDQIAIRYWEVMCHSGEHYNHLLTHKTSVAFTFTYLNITPSHNLHGIPIGRSLKALQAYEWWPMAKLYIYIYIYYLLFIHEKCLYFFYREFQPKVFASDNSSLLSNQDTNWFLV